MLLNFQRQFARPVLDGRKRQTIRAFGRRQVPAPGQWAHCYTGLRTRSAIKLGSWRIASVQVLRMGLRQSGFGEVILGADRLSSSDLAKLAEADGFRGTVAMHKWFTAYHGDGDFNGWVIAWDWMPVTPEVVLPWEPAPTAEASDES